MKEHLINIVMSILKCFDLCRLRVSGIKLFNEVAGNKAVFFSWCTSIGTICM